MRRRSFLAAVVGGSAAAHAWAQSPGKAVRIGYLAVARNDRLFRVLVEALREHGYVHGVNLEIDDRTAEGRAEMLDDLASEAAHLRPDVIVTLGNAASRATRRATQSIPVVFAPSGDAVGAGLVKSLAKPEANLTGLSLDIWIINQKRLEILKQAFPQVGRVAVLANLMNPSGLIQWELAQRAGAALNLSMNLTAIRAKDDLAAALAEIVSSRADALHVASDPFFDTVRDRIVAFATEKRLSAVYEHRAFAEAGGLMSYGPNLDQMTVRAAWYVDRILKGVRPSQLPVEQPTHFELLVNLKTARASSIEIAPEILALADEVIE